jgi:hypothetical protein
MAEEGGFFSGDRNVNETAWDVVGCIPGVGEVVNGFNAVKDLGNVIAPDDGVDRGQAMRDLAQDATSAIPLIGRALDAGRVVYDAIAGNDNSHDFVDRAMGGPGGGTPNQDVFNDDHPPTGPQVCQ